MHRLSTNMANLFARFGKNRMPGFSIGRALMYTKILIATSVRWIATSRLAIALADAGCAVEAVCPGDHSLRKIGAVERCHPYSALAPLRSLTTERPSICIFSTGICYPVSHPAQILRCAGSVLSSDVRSVLPPIVGR